MKLVVYADLGVAPPPHNFPMFASKVLKVDIVLGWKKVPRGIWLLWSLEIKGTLIRLMTASAQYAYSLQAVNCLFRRVQVDPP